MKKLFAALATVLMVGTSATTIVACRKPTYDIEILLVPSKSPLEIESELFNLSKQFQDIFNGVSGSNLNVGFKVSPDYNIASYVLKSGQAAMGMIPVTTYYQKDVKEKERKLGTLFVSTRTAIKTELRSYGTELGVDDGVTLAQLNSFQDDMNTGANMPLDEDLENQFRIAQESNKAYAQETKNIYFTAEDKEAAKLDPNDDQVISNAEHYRSVIFANKNFVKNRKVEVAQLPRGEQYASRFNKHLGWRNDTVIDAYEKLDDNLNFPEYSEEVQKAHSVIVLDLFCKSMEDKNSGKVGLASSATSGAGMVKPVETLINNFIAQTGKSIESDKDIEAAKTFATDVLTGYFKSAGYATELPMAVKDGKLNIGVAFNDARAESQMKEEAGNAEELDFLSNTWMLTTSSGIMNDGMLYSKTFFKRNDISKVTDTPENSTGNNLLDALRKSFMDLMATDEGLDVMRNIYSHEGYIPKPIKDFKEGSPEYDAAVKEAQESPLNAAASEVALAINK